MPLVLMVCVRSCVFVSSFQTLDSSDARSPPPGRKRPHEWGLPLPEGFGGRVFDGSLGLEGPPHVTEYGH